MKIAPSYKVCLRMMCNVVMGLSLLVMAHGITSKLAQAQDGNLGTIDKKPGKFQGKDLIIDPKDIIIDPSVLGSTSKPLRGWVDFHTHPMSHLGFGEKGLHGAPDGAPDEKGIIIPANTTLGCNTPERRARNMEEALGKSDNATHGGWGLDNPCGDYLRAGIINNALDSGYWYTVGIEGNLHNDHPHDGYPEFRHWPHHSSRLHQQMWWEWVKRAYEGGLRVLVALAVNSETLAEILNGNPPYDDKTVAERQIKETIRFVKRHPDFMEIAKSAADAERIIRDNKMAVVLGIEVDKLGNLGKPGVTTNERTVRAAIRELHEMGVRYVFPIHLIDNAFGGTAVYNILFSLLNRNQNGSFPSITSSSDPLVSFRHTMESPIGGFEVPGGLSFPAFAHISAILEGIGRIPILEPSCFDFIKCNGPIPCVAACGSYDKIKRILMPNLNDFHVFSRIPGGHVNAMGLTQLGRVAIRELMRLGMIIDIDHMSERAMRQAFEEAEAVPGYYPLAMGHTAVRKPGGNERNAPSDLFRKIAKGGGMIGAGTSEKNANDFVREYKRIFNTLREEVGGAASSLIGLGTDVNGYEPLPHRGIPESEFGRDRHIRVKGDAWGHPPATLHCPAGVIDVRAARIGCLDIQRSYNLTVLVAEKCNDKKECYYKAPTPTQYRAREVKAATRDHCSQAMDIVYQCSDSSTAVNDSRNFYASFFQESGISTKQQKPEHSGEWDYIAEGGVSHYGLMPEFLHEVKQYDPSVFEGLMSSADGFVRMWKKAERASQRMSGDTPSVDRPSNPPLHSLAATSWGPNRIDVFGVDASGRVHQRAWDGRSWQQAELGNQFGGGKRFVGPLTATSWGPNRIDVFGLDGQGNVLQLAWDGRWHWSVLGSKFSGGKRFVGPLTATSWGPNRIDVFGLDGQGNVLQLAWDGRWHWSVLGSKFSGGKRFVGPLAAVSWGPGRIDVFGLDANKNVLQLWFTNGWHWSQLGSKFAKGARFSGPLAAASWGPGRLDVFGTDTQGNVLQLWFANGWRWSKLGNRFSGGKRFVGPMTAASWGPGRIDVFGVDASKKVLQLSFANGWRWSQLDP